MLACLIGNIRARARPMAAFSGFYESHKPPTSGDAHDSTATSRWPLKRPSKWIHITSFFVCCCPGGRQGDTERVVARGWHPVASGEALVMLHWVMLHVSLQCLRMAIKMACDGGAFVRCRRLFLLA